MGSRGGNLTDLMQAQFSNGNKLPFGPNMGSGVVDWATVHTRWVTTAIKAGLVKDGHPKSITIDVMTSLGHLCDVIGLRANFVVEIDKERLRTHLTTFAKKNDGITDQGTNVPFTTLDEKDPFWGLESINFLPNMFRNMIDEWIMRHNGAEVDHKDTRQLNLMGMDQYFKEEAKYYAVLMNGREETKLKHDSVGGPKYIYFDEVKQRWAQKNHNAKSTTKSNPVDANSAPIYPGSYNPAVNIRPCEPMDYRVYKPQLEELAEKSVDKDVHAVYDQYYSDLYTVLGIRDLSRQKYQRKNAAAVAGTNGGTDQPALTKGRPLYIRPGLYNNGTATSTPAGTTPIYTHDSFNGTGATYVSNTPVMKTIDDIVDILGGEKFVFPMEYVLQTVFHRHMKDAIDILNFVNNPEFEITFTYFTHWIQNFAEVGGFVDLKLENFEVVTRYHDVTRAVWDREFHGRGQHTRPLVDFQWHHNNFTAKFTAGGHPESAQGKTIVHKIWPQNLDNIVRMVYILIQSREHFDKLNSNNISHKYFDILQSVEWKINGEIFGKKTMDDVDQKVRTNFHYCKKKPHSVVRDQTWVHNMSFDMDMNNYKGGTINMLPIANNNEWCLTFSIPKLIALYNSQFAEAAYLSLADIEAMREFIPASTGSVNANSDWNGDQCLDTNLAGFRDVGSGDLIVKGNMFKTSVGSHQGGIRRTKAASWTVDNPQYDYEVNLFIALQCHVPNIYMQQDGQTHSVRRLPGKA